MPPPHAPTTRPRVSGGKALATAVAAVAAALALGGCSGPPEWANLQPAAEYAKQTKPPGSVYSGWRVFQQRCADCHGTEATGGNGGPDLTQRVRGMGMNRFVDIVLLRYDWGLPAAPAGAPRQAQVEEVAAGRAGAVTMPAWQGEPVVTAHVADLYAYLSARAAGTQPPGRPAP
jgi:mono/diheme cytochrome c family protein